MDDTWFKVYRKLEEWEWYADSYCVHLLIHFLIRANISNSRFQGVEIFRGQLVVGRGKLSEATGIPEQVIRTRLKRMEKSGEIFVKSTNKFSIITVRKYEHYQGNGKCHQPATNQQLTSNQPATNHTIRSKEVKKERIKEYMSGQEESRPKIPYAEIISYLNEKAKTNYRPTTDVTKQHIRARWNEGFSLKDFFTVIDHKVDEWSTSEKMVKFLRPQTLFGTRFESYLQSSPEYRPPEPEQEKIELPSLEELEELDRKLKEERLAKSSAVD